MTRRRCVVLFVAVALLATGLSTTAFASGRVGDYIVTLRSGAGTSGPAMSKAYGGSSGLVFDAVFQGFVFHGPASAANRLSGDPRVAAVERDGTAHTVDDAPPGATQLTVDDAHKARDGYGGNGPYTGDGAAQRTRIAIVDTGVMWNHPYFKEDGGNVIGRGFGGCVGAPNARDLNGHGTATASNAAGQAGVAKDANIIGVKVFPGGSDNTSWSAVICGLNYVLKYNRKHPTLAENIDVVNMSIAGSGSPALHRAVEAVIKHGIVVVAAAGNDGGRVQAPAQYAGVISASALNHTGTAFAPFSARHADVAAPGVHIFSANLNGGADTSRSGTSRAAPQVTGAVAVILAINPAAPVRQILVESGRCPNGTERGASSCGAWSGGGGSNEPLIDTYCAAIDTDVATDPVTCPAVT